MKAYCVKCRRKVDVGKTTSVTLRNNRKAKQGNCPKCGTAVYKIGG